MQPHDEIARWAIERYGGDPGNTRWYCEQGAPGWWIMRYLLECYLYGQNENLEYSGVPVMGLEKPVMLTASQARRVSDELIFLLPVFLKAAQHDAGAQEQVEIIKQVANPQRQGFPASKIKAFFGKMPGPSLARAFKIVGWMGQISGAVTLLHESARIDEGVVRLLPADRARAFPHIYERVKAVFRGHNDRLVSLAIGVYRNELEREGIHIAERTLRDDFAAYKRRKRKRSEKSIPVYIHAYNDQGELQPNKKRTLFIGLSTDEWKENYRRTRQK